MVPLGLVALKELADQMLAPFVTLGTVAGGLAILGAMLGKAEAIENKLSAEEADAHVQGCYNDGLVLGGTLAFFPVALLLVEAFR
jgi:hypothetical protein